MFIWHVTRDRPCRDCCSFIQASSQQGRRCALASSPGRQARMQPRAGPVTGCTGGEGSPTPPVPSIPGTCSVFPPPATPALHLLQSAQENQENTPNPPQPTKLHSSAISKVNATNVYYWEVFKVHKSQEKPKIYFQKPIDAQSQRGLNWSYFKVLKLPSELIFFETWYLAKVMVGWYFTGHLGHAQPSSDESTARLIHLINQEPWTWEPVKPLHPWLCMPIYRSFWFSRNSNSPNISLLCHKSWFDSPTRRSS